MTAAAPAIDGKAPARSGGIGSLLKLELKRLRRNRRHLILSVLFPAGLFALFSSFPNQRNIGGVSGMAYYMVAMSTYAAFASLFSGGGLISAERAVGWPRQLRIGGLSGPRYVATKVLVAYVSALPGIVAVLFLATVIHHVDLPATHWTGVILSILLGALPIAALGVAIGYLVSPEALQPILGFGVTILGFSGGMFIPISIFPKTLVDIVKVFPAYWGADAGRMALFGSWVGWQGLFTLLAWTVALGALAGWAYRRDSLRPGVVGAT